MFEDENLALEEEFENGGQEDFVGLQENPVDDGQEDVVDLQELEEEEDGAGGSAQEPGAAAQAVRKPIQSQQDNAAARMARLHTEQTLRQKYDAEIAGLGIINPYTEQPFQSLEDLKAYGAKFREDQRKAEAKKRGTTVEALQEEEADRDFLRRMRQAEADRNRAAQEQAQQTAFMMADLQRFQSEHPDVDVEKLEKNEKFLRFAGKRLYKEPLSELYDDFVAIVSESEQAAVARAAGKRSRSTGGGQGGSGGALTPGQQAELEAWNRENPEMKMTAKEFLAL